MDSFLGIFTPPPFAFVDYVVLWTFDLPPSNPTWFMDDDPFSGYSDKQAVKAYIYRREQNFTHPFSKALQ